MRFTSNNITDLLLKVEHNDFSMQMSLKAVNYSGKT